MGKGEGDSTPEGSRGAFLFFCLIVWRLSLELCVVFLIFLTENSRVSSFLFIPDENHGDFYLLVNRWKQ